MKGENLVDNEKKKKKSKMSQTIKGTIAFGCSFCAACQMT